MPLPSATGHVGACPRDGWTFQRRLLGVPRPGVTLVCPVWACSSGTFRDHPLGLSVFKVGFGDAPKCSSAVDSACLPGPPGADFVGNLSMLGAECQSRDRRAEILPVLGFHYVSVALVECIDPRHQGSKASLHDPCKRHAKLPEVYRWRFADPLPGPCGPAARERQVRTACRSCRPPAAATFPRSR